MTTPSETPQSQEDFDSSRLTIEQKKNKKEGKKKKDNRSLDYVRPHRCDVRLEEFFAGTWKTWNPLVSISLFSTFVKCLRSPIGQEPTNPLEYISDDAYLIYTEIYEKGRVRGKFFENTEAHLAKNQASSSSESHSSLPPLKRKPENK